MIALWTISASAIEPDGFAVEVGLGPALLHARAATSVGPAAELALARGLTEVLTGRVSLGVQAQRRSPDNLPARWQRGAVAALGLRAVYDVVRVVPFAEIGAGIAVMSDSDVTAGWWLAPQASVGAIYLIDRRWSLTPALRVRPLLFRIAGGSARGVNRAFAGDVTVWLGRSY